MPYSTNGYMSDYALQLPTGQHLVPQPDQQQLQQAARQAYEGLPYSHNGVVADYPEQPQQHSSHFQDTFIQHVSPPCTSDEQDSSAFPRLVLQLSAAINEQQQQPQQQSCYQAYQIQRQQQNANSVLDSPRMQPKESSPSGVHRVMKLSRPGRWSSGPSIQNGTSEHGPHDFSRQGSGEMQGMASAGSSAHDMGRCKPCAFMWTKGCENGAQCEFCHLCEPGEKKKRRKEKIENRRTIQHMRQTLTGGLTSWWEGIRGRQNNQNDPPTN